MSTIRIETAKTLKNKPSFQDLGFGRFFTDHLFMIDYSRQKGWIHSRIVPFQNFSMHPAAAVFHYGQALFEGMKAFRQKNDSLVLFRPQFNLHRLAQGADRLCLPVPSAEMMLEGIEKLVRLEKDWIPENSQGSLYIRPTLIGTEGFLGVRPSDEALFYVILSPVGSYYGGDYAPISIWVETEDLRAAPGGLGATKAGANYAASLRAAMRAKKKNYSQVLWLDSRRHSIEEVGTMNVFFVIKDQLITPSLNGSILEGNTRACVIELARKWGWTVHEREVELQEIIDASKNGTLQECFGTGTAAVITPVGRLDSPHFKIEVNKNQVGAKTEKLYKAILSIQNGDATDFKNWIHPL